MLISVAIILLGSYQFTSCWSVVRLGKSKCGAMRWLVRLVAPLLILPKRWLVRSFVCLLNLSTVVHRVTDNGWVFAKLPLQILQIKHKCWWAILQIPC
jgi:hypothetical protein